LAKVGRLADAKVEAERVVALNPTTGLTIPVSFVLRADELIE
jgi:hypothetical protein